MPTLTIQTTSGDPAANSYATVAELDTYADERGLSLPADTDAKERLLIQANDYLETLEDKFQGVRTNASQVTAFPRDGVRLFNDWISGTIPDILKDAQCQIAADIHGGLSLLASSEGKEVIEEAVGPLRTKYRSSGTSTPAAVPAKALAMLQPLFSGNLSGANARIIR